ncbi:hypothetical protein J6590_072017 [Homalodisca vitripennis]|nr:hypothetical protein J6590_072017 [Homalodisca vitripennis]
MAAIVPPLAATERISSGWGGGGEAQFQLSLANRSADAVRRRVIHPALSARRRHLAPQSYSIRDILLATARTEVKVIADIEVKAGTTKL